jgi:simple sugar transport system ATP-binding protein
MRAEEFEMMSHREAREGSSAPALLEMRGIVKRYGSVLANGGIDFTVGEQSVIGLLGENGSGKSTLMKVLFGMVRPDSGQILFEGRPLSGHSPKEALSAGIGMIHQHFTLVEAMTVVENVMLGWRHPRGLLKTSEIAKQILEASQAYDLAVNPDDRVSELSFGQRQRVEIVKAILRGSKLLILDEPTSNLSGPEVAGLLAVIRRLRENGHSVVFISHKIGEVIAVCDEVVVLRDGQVAGQVPIAGATRESLVRMMVERNFSEPAIPGRGTPGAPLLTVSNLSRRADSAGRALRDINLTIRAGEILAVAGIDGNGQRELLDVLAGVLRAEDGQIRLGETDISVMSVRQRLHAGLAYIPVDRTGTSLVPGFTIAENLAMRDLDRRPFSRGPFLDLQAIRAAAENAISKFGIRASSAEAPASSLSGGNQQKIVLAREISRRPKVLLAFQPTWGLDPGAVRFVTDQLLSLRDSGAAILYVSAEIEEVLTLGDRVAVLSAGELSPPAGRGQIDATRIGTLMAGAA